MFYIILHLTIHYFMIACAKKMMRHGNENEYIHTYIHTYILETDSMRGGLLPVSRYLLSIHSGHRKATNTAFIYFLKKLVTVLKVFKILLHCKAVD
jgi:hypothetical protein